jgi:hypothetical protein
VQASYGSLYTCFCVSLLGLGGGGPYPVHSYIVCIGFPYCRKSNHVAIKPCICYGCVDGSIMVVLTVVLWLC